MRFPLGGRIPLRQVDPWAIIPKVPYNIDNAAKSDVTKPGVD